MSAAQHQALVLGGVSFVAFIVFLCFLVPSRRTRFSVFAACNLLFVALMFGAARPTTLAWSCHRRGTSLAISGHARLRPRSAPVLRAEGSDHGPRGTLLERCGGGLCDGRTGSRAQTTLLLQEPRLLRGHGMHSRHSVRVDGLRRLESLVLRGRPAGPFGGAEHRRGMPGHLLHPRFHRRTLPTVYAGRRHDAPAQAPDRMAPCPGTV